MIFPVEKDIFSPPDDYFCISHKKVLPFLWKWYIIGLLDMNACNGRMIFHHRHG